MEQRLHVVAAVIRGDDGRYLMTRRLPQAREGGKWEFPGGKVERDESPQRALGRELREELGMVMLSCKPLMQIPYDYPALRILLDVYLVGRYRGIPWPVEGQGMAWFGVQELTRLDMPAANRAIVAALRLPPFYLITPSPSGDEAQFLNRLDSVLRTGIRLVRLRAPDLAREHYLRLSACALEICHARRAELLTDDAQTALAIGADGVHLSSRSLMSMTQRPVPAELWMAASCHDDAELAHAQRIGCDLAVLSPVSPTPSHPDRRALGWDGFNRLCSAVALPVYALGGMRRADLPLAQEHGAFGIAAIRDFWTTSA
jgi:8-oxo-dGTP diphosphatase